MEAQLPPRMEQDKHNKEQEEFDSDKRHYDQHECTFRPEINPDIPDFDYLHQQFAEKLLDAKASKVPTDPETFNLLTSKMKDRIPDVLEDIARDNIILKENRWPYVSTRAPVPPSEKSFRLKKREPLYPEALSSSKRTTAPRSKSAGPRRRDTAKTRAMQESIKKKQEEKAMQAAIVKRKEANIKKRQKEVNRRMQPALRATCRRNDDEVLSPSLSMSFYLLCSFTLFCSPKSSTHHGHYMATLTAVVQARAARVRKFNREQTAKAKRDHEYMMEQVEKRPSIVVTTQQDQMKRHVEDQIQECMEMSGADRIKGVGSFH